MPQKKCVTIYGYSDDLVEIENSQYKEDEIDCYDKAIRFFFVDVNARNLRKKQLSA